MKIKEIIYPYLAKFPKHFNERVITTLTMLQDRIIVLSKLPQRENPLLGLITSVIQMWVFSYIDLYRSLIVFNWYVHDNNNITFTFSTHLPDIENHDFLTINIKHGNIEDYNKVCLMYMTHENVVTGKIADYYQDSFFYFANIYSYLLKRIHERHYVEIYKSFENDIITFQFYSKKEKNFIELILDFNKLDLVRDQWYDFVIRNGFLIEE